MMDKCHLEQTIQVICLLLQNTGDIGIGTSSPGDYNSGGQQLVIVDSGNTGISIIGGSSDSSSILFGDGTGGTAAYRGKIEYDHATDHMQFNVAASEALRIDSSGNVGIGATPSHRLDVKGLDTDNETIARFYSNTSTRGSFGIKNGVGVLPTMFIGTLGGSEELAIGVNSAEVIRIDAAEYVGIGTTDPKAKLHLSGSSAAASGFKTI